MAFQLGQERMSAIRSGRALLRPTQPSQDGSRNQPKSIEIWVVRSGKPMKKNTEPFQSLPKCRFQIQLVRMPPKMSFLHVVQDRLRKGSRIYVTRRFFTAPVLNPSASLRIGLPRGLA
jgi:hypothetical protein